MYLSLEKKDKNRKAVIDDNGKTMTYGELIHSAEEVSSILCERYVVFILNDNTTDSVAAYISCMVNNAVPLMLGSTMDEQLLSNLIDTYEPAFIWKSKETLKENEIIKAYIGDFVLVSTGKQRYEINEKLALLLTTSGSTGSPKLVRHTYKNLESQGKNISAFFNLTEKDRPMIDLPINYTFGLSVLNSHLYVGATCLITNMSVLEPKYWEFLKDEKATSITGVPYTFEILKKIRFFKMDLPYLELISQGGGKLSSELFDEIAHYAKDNGKRFIATYGQTEGSARMAYLPPEDALRKNGSIGKAIPNGRLYVIDDSGNEIDSPVAEGEMVYEGPNVTMGYAICKEDLKKGDERNGVLPTGDIVRRDSEGYFYIIGRKKRFLKLNGYRVGLDESENLIKGQFEIECACVGDDKVMRIIVTEEVDEKEIRAFIAQKTGINMSFFKVIRIDSIPRNDAGKILYSKL